MEAKPEVELEPLRPDDDVELLKGVGPVVRERLGAAGIATIRDLLLCFPKRVRELEEASELVGADAGKWVRVRARVTGSKLRFLPRRRSLVTVDLMSSGGTPFSVPFFNQPYLKNTYPAGNEYLVEGVLARTGKKWQVQQGRLLAVDAVREGACQVRYPELEGVPGRRLETWIQHALERVDLESWPGEQVPDSLRSEVEFADLGAALRAMHTPRRAEEHDAARRRFALLEAVKLFRRVERARRRRQARRGPEVRLTEGVTKLVRTVLPFEWTDDQRAAVAVLERAFGETSPMGLLLQGDVGTGKTAVALFAALAVIASGHQAAFLAPTELLAEQHYEGLRSWLASTDLQVELLTGSLPAAARRAVDEELRSGRADLVVGTHALFSESTEFRSLGLVVIDEQHRFGVDQRMRLVAKGQDPHVMVMTATPIPRTLTLCLFSDLDVATLREKPRGRPVPAVFVEPKHWLRIVAAIGRHLARGAQVYVVCPRIGEEGEKGGAVRLHAELSRQFPAGLVHGRMPVDERRAATEAFRSGEVPLLVGTTVLEVGVDVAAATLMVVIGADRLGLATLHQLRGRVGRGERRGLCVLTGEPTDRVEAVCETTDGFALAEMDLRLRGSGELLGQRQSGLADLRALDAASDLDILSRAREAVRQEPEP